MTNASEGGANNTTKSHNDNRYTLDWWKLYLDSCATYQYFLAKEFLTGIQDGDTLSPGSCNIFTTVTNTRGWGLKCGSMNRGFTNICSVPMLQSVGYIVSSRTQKNCVVFSPKGKHTGFKRELVYARGCRISTYVKNKVGMKMIEMVCTYFESYAKK